MPRPITLLIGQGADLEVEGAGRQARRTLARALVAVVTASLAWAATAPAAAHEELVYYDPPESGTVEALPSRAILTFTGEISEVRELTVTGPDGSVVNGGPTTAGSEVRQNLWAGPDGEYTMTYVAVSSDGHELRGGIRFTVGATSVPGGRATRSGRDSETHGSRGLGRDVVVPATLIFLAGAGSLLLWRRRRAGSRS